MHGSCCLGEVGQIKKKLCIIFLVNQYGTRTFTANNYSTSACFCESITILCENNSNRGNYFIFIFCKIMFLKPTAGLRCSFFFHPHLAKSLQQICFFSVFCILVGNFLYFRKTSYWFDVFSWYDFRWYANYYFTLFKLFRNRYF